MLALSDVDAAYIAGIIDGEGTITLSRLHRNEQRRIVVSVSNNERALLEYIQQTVGAGRISNKRTYGENHAPAFHYQINSRQALDLLRQTASYLRTYKAVRARLALETYLQVTPRNGKYTAQVLAKRQLFEQTFLGITAPSHNPREHTQAASVERCILNVISSTPRASRPKVESWPTR